MFQKILPAFRRWTILGVIIPCFACVGCDSGEVPIKPMESAKRDDVDKGINNPIDNPYGADIKVQPKVKVRPGGGKTTRD